MRTCVACRRRAPSNDLQRVGWHESRGYFLGRGIGRGAWLCRESNCAQLVTAAQLRRAWRRPVGDDEVGQVTQLLERFALQRNLEL